MKPAARPRPAVGLEVVFLAVAVATLAAALLLTVHRHIYEERTRAVSLIVRVDDYLDLLAGEGVPFERGFDALLAAGIDTLAVGPATLASLERRGAATVITQRELDRLSRLSRAFPDIVLNAPAISREAGPNGLFVLAEEPDLLKRIELSIKNEGLRPVRLVETGGPGRTTGVLLVENAGTDLLHRGIVEDAELYALLRKMGFRLLFDLEAGEGALPLELAGSLARSIERGLFAGVLISRTGAAGIPTPGSAWLIDVAGRGALAGLCFLVDGRPVSTPGGVPDWQAAVAARIVPTRAPRDVPSLGDVTAGLVPFLSRGAARAIVLPARGADFERFRAGSVALAAALRQSGYDLGQRKGTVPVGPTPAAFNALLFLLSLACYALARLGVGRSTLVLALYVVLLVVLVPLLPNLRDLGALESVKFWTGAFIAALLALLPFFVERVHRFAGKDAERALPVALFQAVATHIWLLVLSPLLFSLFYDPFFLDALPLASHRTAALILLAVAVTVAPVTNRRFRNRLAARLLARPVAVRDLLLTAGAVLLFAFALRLGARGAAGGPGDPAYGLGEAVVGVPALILYFYYRLRMRIRYSWILAPLAVLATGGAAFDLAFDASAPVYAAVVALTRRMLLGLLLFALYAAIFRRAARSVDAGEVSPLRDLSSLRDRP